jgi:hypothetical protein
VTQLRSIYIKMKDDNTCSNVYQLLDDIAELYGASNTTEYPINKLEVAYMHDMKDFARYVSCSPEPRRQRR